ncbi:inorganic phosphate transporter [Candidatus Magnetaquicoccus inordinatus]|uniref:inorganic phosphate transporter n=1 Tax=Candidatus Magnetaquicoccus inordinatus TaxID=2496818 RepID=UPI00102B054C|nr:inorganic phosphate transporter [Candidatus Magnetaquicoccus inordinatus]
MDTLFTLAVTAVVIVLIFDYTNGFHDAANIIGTIIASRAMTPIQSVIIVGTFEFLGPILGGTAVANTIGKFITIGDVPPHLSLTIVLCGIWGAIFWNMATWWYGIPSSSSHALVGGLIGAVVVSAGSQNVIWGFSELAQGKFTGFFKILLSLIISPVLGFWAGYFIHRGMRWLLRNEEPSANRWLKRFQFVTAAGLAFSHGANDAQKSMGIITLVLVLGGFVDKFVVPGWVIMSCAVAITLGILSGGWRIVRTVGFGIYKVRPLHALDTQLTSGTLILAASVFGAPVSTTHVVSSAIMGIGSSERPKAVRWAKAKEIVSTWLITIPGSALVAILTYYLVRMITG